MKKYTKEEVDEIKKEIQHSKIKSRHLKFHIGILKDIRRNKVIDFRMSELRILKLIKWLFKYSKKKINQNRPELKEYEIYLNKLLKIWENNESTEFLIESDKQIIKTMLKNMSLISGCE